MTRDEGICDECELSGEVAVIYGELDAVYVCADCLKKALELLSTAPAPA